MSKAPRTADRVAKELAECIKAWRQGDADAEAILREYDAFIVERCNDVIASGFKPMLFSELVKGCTDDERTKLAQHLATLRMVNTLKLSANGR